MSTTKRLDRLGLMGIASAIALTAAVGWSSTAWSADKNAQQWQLPLHSQSQGGQSGGQRQGGQNGGQPQIQFRPQANNRQLQFQNGNGQQWNSHQQVNNQQQWQFKNGQQRMTNQPQWQNRNGQPSYNGQQRVTNQPQWLNRNGQPSYNGQQRVTNQPQWQNRNGQQWNGQPTRNGQFVQQNNNNQWRNAQNGQSHNMQVLTTNVTTRYDWHNYQPGHRPADWDSRNRNVDFRAYQWNRTAQVRYHYRPYEPPHGWYYRHWTYGEVFPTIFWSQNYWLTDYYSFGLDNPPYGYVWVRYGPDALLVNVYNGQILSVEYNVFYA